MANREQVFQKVQLGKEVTPGTKVVSPVLLPDTEMTLDAAGDAGQEYRASGYTVPSAVQSRAEWATGSYRAPFCANQFAYIGDSSIGIAAPSGAGTAKTRVHSLAVNAAPTRQFYTYEQGQTGAVDRHGYGHFNSLNFNIQKQGESGITGDVMAQEGLPTTTLTAATAVAQVLLDPMAFDIYTATTWAILESAPVLVSNVHSLQVQVGPMLGPAFFIGSATRSFNVAGSIVPNSSVTLVEPKDVTGADYNGLMTLAKKRAGTSLFLRAKVLGAEVETAIPSKWQADMVIKALNVPARASINDVLSGNSWALKLFVDVTAQKALEITTVGNLAAT